MGGATVKGLKFGPFGTLKPFIPGPGGKIPFYAIPEDLRPSLLEYPSMAACVDVPEGYLEGLQQAKLDAAVAEREASAGSGPSTPSALPLQISAFDAGGSLVTALVNGLVRLIAEEVGKWLETRLLPLMTSQMTTSPAPSTASSPGPTPSQSPAPSTSSPDRDGSPSEASLSAATTTQESSTTETPSSSKPSGE
jgi:hypothetical protein